LSGARALMRPMTQQPGKQARYASCERTYQHPRCCL
jgi:hypothetical protein